MTNPQPTTQGIHHLGLTVIDVDVTAEFFIRALGFQHIARRPDYPARFISDGKVMLTLWQAQVDTPVPFDRKKGLGLHHFALALAPGQTLEAVLERLQKEEDVEVEFEPQCIGEGPTRHLMCTIPGGIRMEVIAPAQ